MENKLAATAIITFSSLLVACGGSGSDAGGGPVGPSTGTLSLSVSDSPLKDAAKVCVKFDGVELKKTDDSAPFDITFDQPVVINLLANQGAVSESLVSAQVDAGRYEWIRLMVDARAGSGAGLSDSNPNDSSCLDTSNGSYLISDSGAVFNLRVPSGDQTGLKLIKDIVVPANSSGNYTAEWDLGMSFIAPPGQGTNEAMMKPVVKLVANNEVGTLNGTVASELFVVQQGQQAATCPADSEFAPTVFVFDDDGDDQNAIDDDGAGGTRMPIASGLVAQDMNAVGTPYVYEVGFLLAGNYEVALSCDDRATFVPAGGKSATIDIGGTTTVDIGLSDLPVSQ